MVIMANIQDSVVENAVQQVALQKFRTANFLSVPKPAYPALSSYHNNDVEQLQIAGAEALFYYFSNQYDKISTAHLDGLNQLFLMSDENTDNFLVRPKKVNTIEAVKSESLQVLKDNLALLITECRNENFAIRLLENVIENLGITSPFSNGRAYCNESYEVDDGINCLRFTDGNQSFFLMQWVSSADGLYFPGDNILVCLAHVNEIHAQRLQLKLIKNFPNIVGYAKSENDFFGIIASHSRPSHFYYDIWPVLHELSTKPDIFGNIPAVIMRKDHDFNDLKLLFERGNSRVLDAGEIDNIALNEKKWFINIGTNRQLRHGFCYETADRYLVDKVMSSPTGLALEKAVLVEDCYPLVWIGIEGQKRCWLEQVEGYAFILNRLAKKYPRLGVVIDGWTMPFTPSEKSLVQVENDRLVAGKILKLLDGDVKWVSLIGETSNTKIFVGAKVDFFICNFSSGSLHISRLLGKPGFCHLGAEFSEFCLRTETNVHPNRHVYLLPKKYVLDKKDTNPFKANNGASFVPDSVRRFMPAKPAQQEQKKAVNPGKLCYSIEKEVFYRFIEERLPAVLSNTEMSKLSFFIEPSFSVSTDLRFYLKMATHGNLLKVFPSLGFPKKIVDLAVYTESYLKKHVVYGSFSFGAHNALGMQAGYMIWLSDPLTRLRLHVSQIAKVAQSKQQAAKLSHFLKVGNKALDNYYTRTISGADAPFGKCTEEMLAKAMNNLAKDFIFVGINERQSESFDWLCDVMDWDRTLFPDQMANKFQLQSGGFSDEDMALANPLIQYDLRLYKAALDILNKGLNGRLSRADFL